MELKIESKMLRNCPPANFGRAKQVSIKRTLIRSLRLQLVRALGLRPHSPSALKATPFNRNSVSDLVLSLIGSLPPASRLRVQPAVAPVPPVRADIVRQAPRRPGSAVVACAGAATTFGNFAPAHR